MSSVVHRMLLFQNYLIIHTMKKIVLLLAVLFTLQITTNAQTGKKKSVRVSFILSDSSGAEPENVEITAQSMVGNRRFIAVDNQLQLTSAGTYAFHIFAPGFEVLDFKAQLVHDTLLRLILSPNAIVHESVIIKAIKPAQKTGFVQSTLTAAKLAPTNLGQDMPVLMGNTPSAVTTSDAGAGVGYTGIRIRGSDATRINVTVNGIPINDAESHGVYWVNMPDLASSTSSVQIQRGVGSSTVGTGAFGANINVQNIDQSSVPFAQLQQSYGSFNTMKSTLLFGTGNLNGFNFSGRLSKIKSDGYIDRAFSDLQSYQFNMNYTGGKWFINAVAFGGKEKTYQSWYGTPESRVKNDVKGMNDYADRNYLSDEQRSNLLNSGRTYNYYTYANQTDNYGQYHYQLHFNRTMNRYLKLNSSFFTTTGKGYYEEYKDGASFSNYGVSPFVVGTDTITQTNLIRQRWLDNIFYGNFTSFQYKKRNLQVNGGVNVSRYEGKHFGKVIWAEIAAPFGLDQKYYSSTSLKNEFNAFVKGSYKTGKLTVDAELQNRMIHYESKGNDNDRTLIDFNVDYSFFNPKFGLMYQVGTKSNVYANVSVGNREPVRTDFIDNPDSKVPKPENLTDYEWGYTYRNRRNFYQVNFYNMVYKDQLVVTGELNDVGNSLRRNVKNSYRRGIELMLEHEVISKTSLNFNLNLSRNRIKNFEDVYFNYDSYSYNRDIYNNAPIAFSPEMVGFLGVSDRHLRNLELGLNVKMVGKQYLDNTGNSSRQLDPYQVLNFNFLKQFNFKNGSQLVFKGMVNNLLGIFYSNNGYTYKYVAGGSLTQENFYYPQSGRNLMLGLDFKFL